MQVLYTQGIHINTYTHSSDVFKPFYPSHKPLITAVAHILQISETQWFDILTLFDVGIM